MVNIGAQTGNEPLSQEPIMAAIRTARSFLAAAPREALADVAGLGLAGAVIFAAFVLPGLF